MKFRNWILRPWFPYSIAFIVSILTIVLMFQSIDLDREITNKEKRLEVSGQLNQLRAALEGNLYNNANLVRGLAAAIATEPDMGQKRFAAIAKQLFKGRQQLRNIGAAPDLVIRLMYPLKGNERAIGLDFQKNEGQRKAALLAKDQRQIIIAGPLELAQGGEAFIARLPVFIDDESERGGDFWGLISTVIDIQKLYADSGLFAASTTLDIAIQGKDGTGSSGAFFYGDESIAKQEPSIATVSLPYGEWKMYAIPKEGWPVRGERQTFLIVELLIGGAFIVLSLVFAGKLLSEREGITAELNNQKFAMDEHAIVSATDIDGTITYVNDKFCEVSGYSRDELLGKNHRIVNSNYHSGEFFDEMWHTISAGKVWHGEIRNKAKEGTYYWVSSTIVPFLNHDGKPIQYIAVRTDITADKDNQKMLEHTMAEAEIANKTKSEFLASMSHEIRTPMTGILGFTDLLLEENHSRSANKKIMNIKTSATALLGILNDILDLSKLDSGKLEIEKVYFDPSQIANDVTQIFYQTCPANKKDNLIITSKVTADFPKGISADSTRLRQVLINLMGNAVKFTDAGSVTLHCKKVQDSDVLKFQVVDTGIGIDKETQGKLFGDFVQADASISRKYQGTGLGLAICKRLVELMGGEIGIESIPKQGSTFWFTLPYEPLPDGVEIIDEGLTKQRKFLSNRPLSILVAEDNEINQTIIKALLDRMGHESTFANNGTEAVEAAKSQDFDLILMDIRMPELSGTDATRQIRSFSGFKGHTPIIALTADVMAENRQSYFDAGMNDCVAKPINQEELAVAINKAVGETVNVIDDDKEKIPIEKSYNLDEIKSRLGLPSDVIITLLDKFASDYGNIASRIKELADNNDLDSVRELAHALKGVSGSLGMPKIYEQASQIEAEAKVKNAASIQEKITILSSEIDKAVSAIRAQTTNS